MKRQVDKMKKLEDKIAIAVIARAIAHIVLAVIAHAIAHIALIPLPSLEELTKRQVDKTTWRVYVAQ